MPTQSDQSRLAQIAAWHLSHGESETDTVGFLYSIAPGADEDDIKEAIDRANDAIGAASALRINRDVEAQRLALGAGMGPGTNLRIISTVRTGPGVNDYGTIVTYVPYGSTANTIRTRVKEDASNAAAKWGYRAEEGQYDKPDILFIGPG